MLESGSFERSRFGFNLADEFECPICFKIMNEPVRCNGCNKHFCL